MIQLVLKKITCQSRWQLETTKIVRQLWNSKLLNDLFCV